MSQTGTIVRLVPDRGFGFIRDDSTGTEYFFHRSGVAPSHRFEGLRQSMAVSFEQEDSDKGPRAGDVTPLTGNR